MSVAFDSQRMQMLAVRWTQVQPTVAAFVSSILADHHDAEEAIQRAAAAVVAKHHEYDESRPFANWAIGLARIEAMRLRRERHRDSRTKTFDDETMAALEAAFVELEPDAEEMRAALVVCVRGLHGRAREMFELHYVLGLRPAEIAAKFGRSSNAVLVAMHRGRTALRECMERRLGLRREAV